MSTLRTQDRASLCHFTFADGRRCRTPRTANHPYFCYDHARKESQARVAQKIGNDLAFFFSGEYLSACDVSTAIGRLIPAVVRGDIKPKAAATVAYLTQTLVQAIHLSQHEYTNAFGTDDWRQAVRDSVDQNFGHSNPPESPAPARHDPPDHPTESPGPEPATDLNPPPPTSSRANPHS